LEILSSPTGVLGYLTSNLEQMALNLVDRENRDSYSPTRTCVIGVRNDPLDGAGGGETGGMDGCCFGGGFGGGGGD
jgi:hypothetical protein